MRVVESTGPEYVNLLEGIIVTMNDGTVEEIYDKDVNCPEKTSCYQLDLSNGKIVGCEIISKNANNVTDISYGFNFNVAWVNYKDIPEPKLQ